MLQHKIKRHVCSDGDCGQSAVMVTVDVPLHAAVYSGPGWCWAISPASFRFMMYSGMLWYVYRGSGVATE